MAKHTIKQMEFLTQVNQAVKELEQATSVLSGLWAKDHNYDVDLNEYLTDGFPFNASFDEHALNVSSWQEEVEKVLTSPLAPKTEAETLLDNILHAMNSHPNIRLSRAREFKTTYDIAAAIDRFKERNEKR